MNGGSENLVYTDIVKWEKTVEQSTSWTTDFSATIGSSASFDIAFVSVSASVENINRIL